MRTLIFLLLLLQLNQKEITVTLLDADKQPIISESVAFKNEHHEVLASCITNTRGRCTITLHIETDMTRGSLVTEFGLKPIIFRGETFEITLTLNETHELQIPSDAYVTRTPKPTAKPKKNTSPTEPTETESPTEPTETESPTEPTETESPTEPTKTTSPTKARFNTPTEPEPSPLPNLSIKEVILIIIATFSIAFYMLSGQLEKRKKK